MKKQTIISMLFGAMGLGVAFTSCDDMLDKGNDYVIYADDRYLNTAADTVSSLVGILNQLQGIAVRTNLFGELRGDLVEVQDFAKNDLKAIADFSILEPKMEGDVENAYNNPRAYYSVINNCNFFLARADANAGVESRNKKYLTAEIAQVHSIRAWVYLQLAMVYGKVPYITEPILTKQDAEREEFDNSNQKDFEGIIDALLDDLAPYASHDPHVDIENELPNPNLGTGVDAKFAFFPVQLVMGDLYLWKAAFLGNNDAGKEAAKRAALCYFKYIKWNKSGKSPMQTNPDVQGWKPQALINQSFEKSDVKDRLYSDNKNHWAPFMTPDIANAHWGSDDGQTITCIMMDSVTADASYNELRDFYYQTNEDNVDGPCILPSKALKDLSSSQVYMQKNSNEVLVTVTPDKVSEEMAEQYCVGDLRLYAVMDTRGVRNGKVLTTVPKNLKHMGKHVGIYRNTQVWLRLAEALNYAGYPRFARAILTTGIDTEVMNKAVRPFYPSDEDSLYLRNFQMEDGWTTFVANIREVTDDATGCKIEQRDVTYKSKCNMYGIHYRGSGEVYYDEDYCPLAKIDSVGFPDDLLSAIHKPSKKEPIKPEEPYDGVKPSTWAQLPGQKMGFDAYVAFADLVINKEKEYQLYCDSVDVWNSFLANEWEAYKTAYEDYLIEYQPFCEARDAFLAAYKPWNIQYYAQAVKPEQKIVDQAVLDEQALELAFEGNRYYDLMRRALFWQDKTKLSAPIEKRISDEIANGKVVNMPTFGDHISRTNWFLNWRGKLGL